MKNETTKELKSKLEQTEELLAYKDQKFDLLMESANMGFWDWDVESGKVEWTSTLERIHGIKKGTFPGTFEAFLSDIHPEDRAKVEQKIKEILDSNENNYEVLYRIIKPDNEIRWVEARGSVFRGKDGEAKILMGVCMDVTEKMKEQEMMEHFLGIVGHELKSPLASIKAYAQLVQRWLAKEKTDEAKNYLDKIDFQVNRLASLVNDLMDVTRIRAGVFSLNYREFDLDSLVKRIVADHSEITKDKQLKLKGTTKTKFFGDEDRLSQVIVNLVSNALVHSESDEIIVETQRKNGKIKLSVVDSGQGIPKQHQKEIFELFRQGSSGEGKNKGLGMGLYIASAIVKEHGGEITLSSKKGKGSRFTVHLPVSSNDDE